MFDHLKALLISHFFLYVKHMYEFKNPLDLIHHDILTFSLQEQIKHFSFYILKTTEFNLICID